MLDPWEVATFRFEQISPLLDERLSRAERRRLLREKTRQPVEWPQSQDDRKAGKRPKKKPITHSTLKRWLTLYRRQRIVGLLPQRRKDSGAEKAIEENAIAYALALLWEEPDRSLSQLLFYLKIEFPDSPVKRSTLHRHLLSHPAYQGIEKLRKGKKSEKLYDLYETSRPHECWQLDGKGPFTVRLESGKKLRVHALTVIDCFSRYVLATIVAPAEDTAATVRVFRLAAARYGLPERIQFDKGSAFDSKIFRSGLAHLGVHRNPAKPRTPEWQAIIEAFHKLLGRWFVTETKHQVIVDFSHLEALLQATIEVLYNREHRHRILKMTPTEALAGAMSSRRVSSRDLLRAFWVTETAISHAKTGEVILPNGSFRVSARHAGRKRTFRYDPVEPDVAVLLLKDNQEIPLEPFRKKRAFENDRPEARGSGQLQKILDIHRGQVRPNAQPGFGLPEVFRQLSRLLGYLVPRDEREAATVAAFYQRHGPLPRTPFTRAMEKTARDLGPGRPLKAYLDHLERLIRQDQKPKGMEETS